MVVPSFGVEPTLARPGVKHDSATKHAENAAGDNEKSAPVK
jgi:hypothetical protein